MCLAIPGKVIEIENDPQGVRMAKANFGGIVKQVCLEYTPEVELGDYVLVHVGFALGRIDEAEAIRTYKALEAMQQLGELQDSEVSPPRPPDQETIGAHP
ncbi:MAG: hydrogenase assembly chaperone hypC/hupF [Pedosphaera sp.]|nr:hydrogenase assembly chaperone hypC/hupF [Pedosphaera sp.]